MRDIPEHIVHLLIDGRLDEARQAVERAALGQGAAADPVEVLNAWGAGLSEAGRHELAAALYALALERFPDQAVLLANHGLALLDLGRRDEAETTLRAALRECPHDPAYQYNIGYFHESGAEWAKARERYEAAARRDRRFAPAHCGIARCEEALGNMAAAARAYDKCLEIDPTRLSVWLSAARAHQLAGHSDIMRMYLERALGLAPDDPQVHFYSLVGAFHARDREALSAERAWFKARDPNGTEYALAVCALARLEGDAATVRAMAWQAARRALEQEEGAVNWDRASFALSWAMSALVDIHDDEQIQALYEYALPFGLLPPSFLADYRQASATPIDFALQVQLVVDAVGAEARSARGLPMLAGRYLRSYTVLARDEHEARLIAVRSEWEMGGRDVRVERVVSAHPIYRVHPGLSYVSGKIPYIG